MNFSDAVSQLNHNPSDFVIAINEEAFFTPSFLKILWRCVSIVFRDKKSLSAICFDVNPFSINLMISISREVSEEAFMFFSAVISCSVSIRLPFAKILSIACCLSYSSNHLFSEIS